MKAESAETGGMASDQLVPPIRHKPLNEFVHRSVAAKRVFNDSARIKKHPLTARL
jgi:hypothetical protein